jgi:hypothetical protein
MSTLKAQWHLDEIAGINGDDSIDSHDAIFAVEPTWAAGRWNNAATIAVNGLAVIPAHVDFNYSYDTPFTWCCWFKASGDGHLITKWISGHYIILELYDGGKLYATVRDSAGAQKKSYSASGYADGAWHFAVFTFDGTDTATAIRIYVDDVLDTEVALNNTLTVFGIDDVNINFGGYGDSTTSLAGGSLDEIRIFDGVISSSLRTSLYEHNSTTTSSSSSSSSSHSPSSSSFSSCSSCSSSSSNISVSSCSSCSISCTEPYNINEFIVLVEAGLPIKLVLTLSNTELILAVSIKKKKDISKKTKSNQRFIILNPTNPEFDLGTAFTANEVLESYDIRKAITTGAVLARHGTVELSSVPTTL